MKELLLKLKEAYLEYVSRHKVGDKYVASDCVGLCFTAHKSLSWDDENLFQNYLYKYKKRRKVFYHSDGTKTDCKSQFLWKPRDIEVRIAWLDEQIAKLS